MSIAVIPGIFYENDFLNFKESTFKALEDILCDVTALMFREYLRNPEARQDVKDLIVQNIGETVYSYTFHKDLEALQILPLLNAIQHESILSAPEEYQNEVLSCLQFLLDNEKRIRAIIPKREHASYSHFINALGELPNTWENTQLFETIQANRYLFYNPHEKDISLPTATILRRKNSWVMCYDAIRYDRYCRSHGVSYEDRFSFG